MTECSIPAAFKTVWLVDTEFIPDDPLCHPVCLVAQEFRSGKTVRLWQEELGPAPPYSTASDSLFVAYNAQAELEFHLALGWQLPTRVLDLYFEFRHRTSGVWPPRQHRRLVDALPFFGLSGLDAVEKQEMTGLILRGPPWSQQEQEDILEYCESDVTALSKLLPAMAPEIRWPYAVYRGRYSAALASTATAGTPIDAPLYRRLNDNWEAIQDRFIREIDTNYGVYEGRTFKMEKFGQWLAQENIAWPRTETGQLNLEDDTFKDLAEAYPKLRPLRQLRQALSGMRLHDLALSKTGRNQCFLNPFGSSTSRNQPSNKAYLWGMPKWLRGLAKPPEGCGVAYLDYGGQEFGVAAALSGDPNMMAAYRTGEAYLWFAKKSDLVPQDATRKTHGAERNLYKSAALAIQYTIGDEGLALHINKPVLFARHLIKLHRELFGQYWHWSDRMVNHAMLVGWQSTVFDWVYRVPPDPRPTTLRNFPIQANGAEVLRLGHCLATENGITVDATAHDAYLISAPLDRLEADIALMRQCMAEASRVVLNGFKLFVDVKEIHFPDRYASSEGEAMWNLMMRLLEEVETAALAYRNDQYAGHVL